MNNSIEKLVYKNDDDRCYGLAGMAISLAALDAIDFVVSISLDAPDMMVNFSHEYYYPGFSGTSPKATWNNLVRNLQITSAMVVSNVFSRKMILDKALRPDSELLDLLYEQIMREGRETCALDDDEIRAIFDKTVRYSQRIFGNPRIHPLIDEFAGVLARRRTMSGNEVLAELHALQLI